MSYRIKNHLTWSIVILTVLICDCLIAENEHHLKTGDEKMRPQTQLITKNPIVVIETSMGTIKVELYADKAPITVSNFLYYVDEKFYDGLIFHRVIKNFVIQGGGFTPDGKNKKAGLPIKNEARADIPNVRGTIAMARTYEVDSAISQFFINLKDNFPLNHRDNTPDGFGYCVFGKVIEGMDVVDQISHVETENRGHLRDIPKQPIVIKSVCRQTEEK